MGAIWTTGSRLCGELSDVVGFKLGLLIELDVLYAVAANNDLDASWLDDPDATYRIRSEVVEDFALSLLAHLGEPDAGDRRPIGIALHAEFAQVPGMDAMFKTLAPALPLITSKPGPNGYDPRPFLDAMRKAHGVSGEIIGMRALELFNARLYASPWSRIRRREWTDVVDLKELFESEQVAATYGAFFDQRFVDFLAANFEDVDRINWRKFEALAAEWFDRLGYLVELGPGRNDDGVDLRAWPQDADLNQPPLLIAQCKREKAKISKVVLKALHTDVLCEGASKGLIVTTSGFAPGTARVNAERGYGIEEAKREVIRGWIEKLRTPGSGIFLAESGSRRGFRMMF